MENSLFRDSGRSGVRIDKYGVGSVIRGDYDNLFLLVAGKDEKTVGVVRCADWTLLGWQGVADPDFLSTGEMRYLCDLCGLNWTFSDFDFDKTTVEGLKGINYSKLK